VPDPATGGPRTFTRQDGTSGAAFEVSANTVRFLSTRGEGEGEMPFGEPGSSGAAEDDIPF
jgi:single-strand DNA-binding protein